MIGGVCASDGLTALTALDVCPEAIRWAEQYPTLEAAWEVCDRGDWMLWLAGRDADLAQGNDRHVRLCYAVCLIWWELAYPWWYEYGEETGDHRPEEAITALEAFCCHPEAAEAARAVWAADAAEAVWAVWAAGAAGAADAAPLARIAEIVRETCLVPVLP